MANSQNKAIVAIGAIGAVLGYIGAESATSTMFERLLWPQRFHANFSWRHYFKTVVFGPSGGPIYKAALEVMDLAFAHGLFKGKRLGHMLGSTFFPQSTTTYTRRSGDDEVDSQARQAGNCLWERVAAMLPPSVPSPQPQQDMEAAVRPENDVRAYSSVHHITLAICKFPAGSSCTLRKDTDSRRLSLRILLGIITSELLGIVFATFIAIVWKSWLAALWLAPLSVKLISAAFALDREDLDLCEPGMANPQAVVMPQDFEVHLPLETSTFLIITGPPSLALQFFRHYGHPKRSRTREVAQLTSVVALSSLFPVGLLLSVTVMPEKIQYMWLSYQMYLVLVMYIARYLSQQTWGSTEEAIAESLANQPKGAYMFADFATRRVVEAKLETTTHGRYGEASAYARALLARKREVSRHPSAIGPMIAGRDLGLEKGAQADGGPM